MRDGHRRRRARRLLEAFEHASDDLVTAVDADAESAEEKVPGPEGVVRVNDRFLAAFTDIDVTKVVTRSSAEGTHSGEFMGIPATGRRVRATGIEIHLVRDRRIAAEWAASDELGLLTQLGAVELRRGA